MSFLRDNRKNHEKITAFLLHPSGSVLLVLRASLIREQLKSNPQWEILRYSVDGKPMQLYVMHPDETTVGIAKDLMNALWEDQVITIPEDYH